MRGSSGICSAALALALVCGVTACAVPPHRPGFDFSLPAPGDYYDAVLWVAPVSIDEPSLRNRQGHEVAFTYNLARYLRQREMFDRVRIAPGQVRDGDWIARLRFQRLREEVVAYAPAIPLSILSLGLYASFGKLQELEVELEATLEIQDAAGRPIASASRTHEASFDVYRRNRTNAVSFFLDERRQFIDDLFDETLEQTL